MLLKLSISSIRKMMKEYMILLAGLVISISVFYMFQTLSLNKDFLEGNSSGIGISSNIDAIFISGSIILSIITIVYILYSNSFLLSLRRKELGMYIMLGAKKSKVAKVLYLETLAVGIVSIAIGIIVGVILSQGVSSFLFKQLGMSNKGYLSFYPKAMIFTLIFFTILFLFTSSINSKKLRSSTELDLIRAEAKSDKVKRSGTLSIVLGVVSVIAIIVGYYTFYNYEKLRSLGVSIGVGSVLLGTYLLFISLLPVFIQWLKSNENRNAKGLNSFTFAQLSFRVNNLSKILGTITILVALGVGSMAAGLALKDNVVISVESLKYYDFAIQQPQKADFDLIEKMNISSKHQYRYKVNKDGVYFLKDDLLANKPIIMEKSKDTKTLITPNDSLPNSIYTASQTKNDLPKQWNEIITTNAVFPRIIYPFGAQEHTDYIVDLKYYNSIEGNESTVLVAKTKDGFDKYIKELNEINNRQNKLYSEEIKSKYLYSFQNAKINIYTTYFSITSGMMFIGLFLGIAFLAMMASCLMFKILSGASKDIARYNMLKKIGVHKRKLTKSIYKELGMIFILPAVIGTLHVSFGLKMLSTTIVDPYINIWTPLSLFFAIYTLYYFITVQLYKAIVLPKEK